LITAASEAFAPANPIGASEDAIFFAVPLVDAAQSWNRLREE